MPPAARVGDMTAHGDALPVGGSMNVLVGGKPAWRAFIDQHICTKATPNPHGGGPVVDGSTSVLINNMPAARMGDKIVEAGPPNSIAVGCSSVIIG